MWVQEPQMVRTIGNRSLGVSEPKFGGFGTVWITLPPIANGLRAIFELVTYSVGNEVNTKATPLGLAYVESA